MQNRGDGYNLAGGAEERDPSPYYPSQDVFCCYPSGYSCGFNVIFFYGLSLRGKELLRLRYREGASSEEFTIEASIE